MIIFLELLPLQKSALLKRRIGEQIVGSNKFPAPGTFPLEISGWYFMGTSQENFMRTF